MHDRLLKSTDRGLYCPQGDFYIDPWKPVERAVITHAHGDHARWGMGRYLCSEESRGVLALRMEESARIDTLAYGESVDMNGVRLSLHPAGHILGSSQIRMEIQGEVVVVSGDYKTEPDSTCTPFEPLRCHTFVTESTFGLPIYHWPKEGLVFEQINEWWRSNQSEGKASILFAYALGKAQRALSGINPELGPIFLHGAVHRLTEAYRSAGINLPQSRQVFEAEPGFDWGKSMIIAPPSANGSPWLRRFGDHSSAFLSGWMTIRGARRRRAVDRGFVLSDHVDWPALLQSVDATHCERVWVTHGYSETVVRYLSEKGLDAHVVATEFEGEQDDASVGVSETEE